MNLKLTVFKVIFVSILLCFAVTATFFWMADPFNFKAPKDQKLLEIFNAHREVFEKLQQMATEDARNGRYLDAPYFDGGSKFDKSRQQEYENIISEIRPGLHVAIDGHDKVVRFIFAGGGTSAIGPGWVKGIEYVPESFEIEGVTYSQGWQGIVSTNLDNARMLPANVYVRQIEPKWFIFYQKTD
jgi:hypothetical protein